MKSHSTTAGARRVPIALLMLTGVVAILQVGSASASMLGGAHVPMPSMVDAIAPSAQGAQGGEE